jgi:hypothetical protein
MPMALFRTADPAIGATVLRCSRIGRDRELGQPLEVYPTRRVELTLAHLDLAAPTVRTTCATLS